MKTINFLPLYLTVFGHALRSEKRVFRLFTNLNFWRNSNRSINYISAAKLKTVRGNSRHTEAHTDYAVKSVK